MTIFKNSIITLGLAVLGFSTVFVISVMVFMNSLYYEINLRSLGNTAKALMLAMGDEEIDEIFLTHDGQIPVMLSLPFNVDDAYRLTLIAPSGYVLWDSHITDRLVNHIDREEVTAALEGREGSSKRDSVSTGMRRIYYALPVLDDNEKVIGVFRLSFSIPEFGARVSVIIIPFVIFICVFIAAAFWAIILYSRSLASSLGRLVNIAQTSTKVFSDPKAIELVAPEFTSLEKAMRAMLQELSLRFEHARLEGNRLEAILNGMSEAVFAMDSELNLHLVNPKARELFNLGDRDIKIGSTMTFLEATRSAELTEIAKKAIAGGASFETQITFHAVTEQIFQVYASPLKTDKKDSGAGVVLVLQDVTRLVKLERVRKDFVANVSHELRTPIQVIKGFSETLADSISNKQNKHFIEIIYKNAGTMENLTNDLLLLADLENNVLSSGSAGAREMEEVNVLSLIDEAVFSTAHQAKKKQIDVKVECEKSLSAKLYGSLVIQALINLIDNSIKYSSKKTKIWVSAFKEDDNLVFEVRDRGIGISSEHLERIFERFYRTDHARSREEGGTGLGLSIVRHIALLHKGNAEAESRVGEGSVFRIRLRSH